MKKNLLFAVALFATCLCFSQNYFITTWSTATPGAPVIIPTTGGGYNYDIDWENDGNFDDIGVTGNITHNYASAGVHTIAVRGDFPRIYFNSGGSNNQLLSIEQWGDIAWTSFVRAFFGCSNLVVNATDAPDLSNVTQMDLMFWRCSSFNQSIDHWDMSNVTSIGGMFSETPYNQPLNSWDVSNVIYMQNLFWKATSFNQPLNNWDVSNVINISYLFNNATSFNQPIDNWDVSNAANMTYMFSYASSFNQPLNSWDVSSVTNMSYMFVGATLFNQPLNTWDVSSVTNMSLMFAVTPYNQSLDNWDVSSVTNMSYMFGNTPFNQSLNNWDVSSVTSMFGMFNNATSFNRRIGSWNVSSVTNMANMFEGATSFNQTLDNWNVSSVTNMSNMFDGVTLFDQTLGTWNVSNVTDMSNMFLGVKLSIANYDDILIGWDALNLQPNVNFHAGISQYCNGALQRTNMINNDGWTITDGGQTICGSLGTDEFDEDDFALSPNPTNNHFSIETKYPISNISVFDVQGKTVKSFKENLAFYDIEDLTSGMYFVNIKTDNGSITKKLIKE